MTLWHENRLWQRRINLFYQKIITGNAYSILSLTQLIHTKCLVQIMHSERACPNGRVINDVWYLLPAVSHHWRRNLFHHKVIMDNTYHKLSVSHIFHTKCLLQMIATCGLANGPAPIVEWSMTLRVGTNCPLFLTTVWVWRSNLFHHKVIIDNAYSILSSIQLIYTKCLLQSMSTGWLENGPAPMVEWSMTLDTYCPLFLTTVWVWRSNLFSSQGNSGQCLFHTFFNSIDLYNMPAT